MILMYHLELTTPQSLLLYILTSCVLYINHCLLQKEGFMMRDERGAIYRYKDKSLGNILTLCPLRRKVVIGCPLGPKT